MKIKILFTLILLLTACTPYSQAESVEDVSSGPQSELAQYLEEVFNSMDENYYLEVSRKIYDDFLKTHTADKLILANKKTHQTENFVHLGGGLLVNKLKHPDDRFTNLIPPTKTKAFKEEVYAMTADLGLKGVLTDKGFEISKVQKHSGAFQEGIRIGDILLKIDGLIVTQMNEETIPKLLKPEVGSVVVLEVLFVETGFTREVSLTAETYFEETVSVHAVPEQWILAIKIAHFNRKTSEDFADLVSEAGLNNIRHFILDLRNNTGGPPLAARELLGFFTPPDDSLFFIVRKNKKPFQLNAPLGYPYYEGPVTLLVNNKTGSAAETFSGVLQAKKTASIVGQKTAGGAYLKSIYDFADGSALIMVTSRTFFHDQSVFPNDGIVPDIQIPQTEDALEKVLESIRENPPLP